MRLPKTAFQHHLCFVYPQPGPALHVQGARSWSEMSVASHCSDGFPSVVFRYHFPRSEDFLPCHKVVAHYQTSFLLGSGLVSGLCYQ